MSSVDNGHFLLPSTASRFADGSGVVLRMQADTGLEEDGVSEREPPSPTRYISVAAISAFDEKELLFVGENVKFKIKQIYPSKQG